MRYLLAILVLLSTICRGQALQGIVTDGQSGKPMYLVSVINRKTGEAVTTGSSGEYSLHADKGDPIAYSFVGYTTVIRYMPPSVLIGTINVQLQVAANELDEVVVTRGKWTRYQLDSMERAEVYKLPLQRKHPSPVLNPASAIAEKFSRKSKRIYEFQKVFAKDEQDQFIGTRYTPKLVTQLTGATGDTIGHFMYACPMPYDFARTCTDLELKMWIRSNYKQWAGRQWPDSTGKK